MPFMQVEVSGPENWIVVDGPCGTEIVPCDICGSLLDYDQFVEETGSDEGYVQAAFEEISDYCENRECYSIEERTGYSGRLSAPGYMDCTEWMGPFDFPDQARRAVIETYDICPACEDHADSPNVGVSPACNFYHY